MPLVTPADIAAELMIDELNDVETAFVTRRETQAEADLEGYLRRPVASRSHTDIIDVRIEDWNDTQPLIVRLFNPPAESIQTVTVLGSPPQVIDPVQYVLRTGNYVEFITFIGPPGLSVLTGGVLKFQIEYTGRVPHHADGVFAGVIVSRLVRELLDRRTLIARDARGEHGVRDIAVEGYSVRYDDFPQKQMADPDSRNGFTSDEIRTVKQFRRRAFA